MTIFSKLNVFCLILVASSYSFGATVVSIPTPVTCTFNGQVMVNDTRVVAYQNSTVPAGQTCVSELRQCVDGVLYGSYAYASCSVSVVPNASCLFNGQTVPDGGSVSAFTASSVAFGQSCTSVAEIRTCNNGVLSGSGAYSSCDPNAPRACLFNAVTVAHGASVNAFQASTSQFGGSCVSETRNCYDGTLSGSFAYNVCNIDAPAGCLFDGRQMADGENVAAFPVSSVSYGQSCVSETRSCSNGVLSGSNNFSSCTVGQPASCAFDNRTMISGESVTAYSSTSVPFGQICSSESRSCLNGQLSGSFASSSCQVDAPSSCLFNGQTVANSGSVLAYSSASVPFGGICASEIRACSNGQLSGSFNSAACSVTLPADCSVNGIAVIHGATTTLFVTSSVPFGQTCQSQQRTCYNGQLSGTATNASCVVENAPPAASCTLNGKTIASGSVVTIYQSSSVAFGNTCVSQARSCLNGVLSGSYLSESCSVQPAANCSFNGQAVVSGTSVIAYSAAVGSPTCLSQQRTCSNGQLSGSYTNLTCMDSLPQSCTLNGKTIASGSSVTVFAQSSVPYGQSCLSEQRLCTNGLLSGSAINESCIIQPKPPVGQCESAKIIWEFAVDTSHKMSGRMIFGSLESRLSRDGGKTWIYLDHRNLPQDLKEIFKYITKQQKLEGTSRPRNLLVDSKHKGYLVIRAEFLPGCGVCSFKEKKKDKEDEDRDDDSKKQKSSDKKSCEKRPAKKEIKFICEDVVISVLSRK
ncbi:MAG: hypothetical protein H7Z71_03730 [Moraxellaceae bacterium]|nr:hypothetical protein [Pseudobdellovibrionaceae bacterium]